MKSSTSGLRRFNFEFYICNIRCQGKQAIAVCAGRPLLALAQQLTDELPKLANLLHGLSIANNHLRLRKKIAAAKI
jgi:hypothetical protein